MKIEIQNKEIRGSDNFTLFWDEQLKFPYNTTERPSRMAYSFLSDYFRKAEEQVQKWHRRSRPLSEV